MLNIRAIDKGPSVSEPVDSTRAPKIWRDEYLLRRVFPSTLRKTPSQALNQAEQRIGKISGVRILDAGAGQGRNSVYLGESNSVIAIDFCIAARQAFARLFPHEYHSVEYRILDLNEDLEFESEFGLILDAYFSCHILDRASLTLWADRTFRYLKPGGLFLTFGFSDRDEYYKSFRQTSIDGFRISHDTISGIDKRIDSVNSISAVFSRLDVVDIVPVRFDDLVVGQSYGREILMGIFRKPN